MKKLQVSRGRDTSNRDILHWLCGSVSGHIPWHSGLASEISVKLHMRHVSHERSRTCLRIKAASTYSDLEDGGEGGEDAMPSGISCLMSSMADRVSHRRVHGWRRRDQAAQDITVGVFRGRLRVQP